MSKFSVSRSFAGPAILLCLLAALASGQSWTPVAAAYPGSGAGASFLYRRHRHGSSGAKLQRCMVQTDPRH